MAKLKTFENDNGGFTHLFYCPGCKEYHAVYSGNNKDMPNWTFNNNDDKPTFSPSLRIRGIGTCHSFIKDGMIQFLNDCTHELKGQTVEIPEYD